MGRDAHTVARINRAVKHCVDEAADSKLPLAVLMRYVDSYRDTAEWSHDDIAEFERGVLLILRKLHMVSEK
jgi:hypothetical protein